MCKSQNAMKIAIEYKNDESATNKVIEFIIDSLLEKSKCGGENIEK